MKKPLLRFFTHDIGRKVLALFFAVVLFDVLDKKVQSEDKLTVDVVYVDEADLARGLPQAADRASQLVVAERGPGSQALVVSPPRPDRINFILHATKDGIERAKSRRHDFVLRLVKEGPLEPQPSDLEGMESLLEALGPGAKVELEQAQWTVEPEEVEPIVLKSDDLVLHGSPPPGYDRPHRTSTFRPAEVRIVGPSSAVQRAKKMRDEGLEGAQLFTPLQLDRRQVEISGDIELTDDWKHSLRLQNPTGESLSAIRVTVKFERMMKFVPSPEGDFEAEVHVIYNDVALRKRDPAKSYKEGWRLEFVKARDGDLPMKLKILAPDDFLNAPVRDRGKLLLAKDNVLLIVVAEDAAGATGPTEVKVAIETRDDFPPELDVVFLDGTKSASVEAVWVPPPSPADKAADQEKEKEQGDGIGGGDGNQ